MKIRRHHCKKGLKTRKGPEFDSDLWENNKDLALQSRKVLQMFVWWGSWGGGGGENLTPQYNHVL